MKKYLLFVVFALLIVSCSDKKESNDTNIMAGKVINLGYDLRKGQENQFKLTTFTSQEQIISGDTNLVLKSSQSESYLIDSKVLMVDDSLFALRLSIPHIDMTTTMDEEEMSYNSDSPDNNDDKRFNDYKSLLNTPFRIIFGRDGDITNILDSEKIVKNMTDAGGVSGRISAEEKKYLTQQLASTALKPLSQQVFRKLPADLVGIDSSWFTSYESALASFIITNNAVFRLKKIEEVNQDTILTIDAILTAKVEGENRMEQQGTTYIFQEPVISGNGKIKFNLSKSVVEYSETTVKIEMLIDVLTKNNQGEDSQIRRKDITINNYKVERVK